jgi:hypothetical protein
MDYLVQQLVAIYCFSLHSRTFPALFYVSCLAILAVGMPTGDVSDWIFHWLCAIVAQNIAF